MKEARVKTRFFGRDACTKQRKAFLSTRDGCVTNMGKTTEYMTVEQTTVKKGILTGGEATLTVIVHVYFPGNGRVSLLRFHVVSRGRY